MAGLGLLLRARGARVTGCDRIASAATRDLGARGILVTTGHDPTHVESTDAVVHTAAVVANHPELVAARRRGLPVSKRSEALAELVNGTRLVAVTGTHGKTTTTALTALVLEACGDDPTALVGGRVPAWGGNARLGAGDLHVVEADEYDRSFLALRPVVAVVTSVEPEHLDTYGTAEAMEEAFDRFVDAVSETGRVVACADDPGATRRLDRAGERGLGYGFKEDVELRAEGIEYVVEGTRFSARHGGRPLGEFTLGLRGRHNVLNALAALGSAIALGLDPERARGALRDFSGVERRFQILGNRGGVTIVDDYAHHPTEVRATLEAARRSFEGRRLVVAFQPHLYSRTRDFADDFAAALSGADLAFVTDIYPAREQPIPGVDADLIAVPLRRDLSPDRVARVGGLDELVEALRSMLRPGDVLLTLGAGDVGGAARTVLETLGQSNVET
jgi:UDP-N-acetylmuramate--alanine ligase